MASSLRNLLNKLRVLLKDGVITPRELGTYFERIACYYIELDPVMSNQYENPQLYADWANEQGKDGRDIGIDIVAKIRGDDGWVAIQCKFVRGIISRRDLDSFFAASGKQEFKRRIIIDTSEQELHHNVLAILEGQDKPVSRISLDNLEVHINWKFARKDGVNARRKADKKKIRPHQQKAVEEVCKGLGKADRGKLIMACGTGKSFTSLLIAEKMVGVGKSVLFMVPSLSLMSQMIRSWAQDQETEQRCFAVCSDAQVDNRRKYKEDIAEIKAHDLAYPATTDPIKLAKEVGPKLPIDSMTVVFATYQSIQVISDAQKNHGLGEFSLIICDEAHRTTGARLAGKDESNFVKIHNQSIIKGKKRLYMTATPRVFGEAAKSKASDESIELCSMDDEAKFGKDLFVRGFGWAVKNKWLSDYRVIVLGIDEARVSASVQNRLVEGAELKLDDATKYIGCYRALAKRGFKEESSLPMQRALAFCKDIKSSKLMKQEFAKVIADYLESDEGQHAEREQKRLNCKVEHVDGTDNAKIRAKRIEWLQEQDEEEACHILSNARCLAEGVDVPELDAILFMHPRKSQIDVVQAVGRVMRKTKNKEMGYVILPVGIPAGIDPQEALNDNKRYHMIWSTLNALRSHDERLESAINKAWLEKDFDLSKHIEIISVSDMPLVETQPPPHGRKLSDTVRPPWQPVFDEWSNAVIAKIVDKNKTPDYWKKWAKNIADIAQAHVSRIHGLVKNPGKEREAFQSFLSEIRDGLNNHITESDTIEMLAQHLVTQPVFEALFGDHSFVQQNPVSRAMEKILEILHNHNIQKERSSLQEFYESIQLRAKGVKDPKARQEIIVELYEGFFRNAFPDMTSRLGIAYTPVALVDFILNSVNAILGKEFGLTLGSEGVHIIDPFAGTGTFVVRLLQSDLLKSSELQHKYQEEMHANEIMPLAYYIAAINIETAYQNSTIAANIDNDEYIPFQGICLTDTFQLDEQEDDSLIGNFLADNSRRRSRQQQLRDIRVIVGNPPYSVRQRGANKDTSPVKYPRLDQRIKETYTDPDTTTTTLYDSYIRAIRWASDRIVDDGVIGYVTNAGWLDGRAGAGVRKSLVEEFSSIYVLHLRGDARTAGEERRKEGGNVFGSSSRAGISIVLLVKNNKITKNGKIFFHNIGDYLSSGEKLQKINEMYSIAGNNGNLAEWDIIIPDCYNDWLRQRVEFPKPHIRIGDRDNEEYLFGIRSGGIFTKRDAWIYNDSKELLGKNIHIMMDAYNKSIGQSEQNRINDPRRISWSRNLRKLLKSGKKLSFNGKAMQIAAYRPFNLRYHYHDKDFNEYMSKMPQIFPGNQLKNRAICITGPIDGDKFSALMTKHACDAAFMGYTQCFPLYVYPANRTGQSKEEGIFGKGERGVAIMDGGLKFFQSAYPGKEICKEDIFYYTYGFLHSPVYRSHFANTLDKELPGIWPVEKYEDFLKFKEAGRKLGNLHCDFNKAPEYPVSFNKGETALVPPHNPQSFYRVDKKMKFAGTGRQKDRKTVIYNPNITITGIPEKAYNYVVNRRPALEWVMERQRIIKDGDSGIVNNPNDFANEAMGDPAYPLKLFQRIITVSLETLKIVENLPPLDLDDKKK